MFALVLIVGRFCQALYFFIESTSYSVALEKAFALFEEAQIKNKTVRVSCKLCTTYFDNTTISFKFFDFDVRICSTLHVSQCQKDQPQVNFKNIILELH